MGSIDRMRKFDGSRGFVSGPNMSYRGREAFELDTMQRLNRYCLSINRREPISVQDTREQLLTVRAIPRHRSKRTAPTRNAHKSGTTLERTSVSMECGTARVTLNGQPTVVDTYSADDIWGVTAFEETLPTAGPHTLTITVLGEHGQHPSDPRADDPNATWVYIDGLRVEDH